MHKSSKSVMEEKKFQQINSENINFKSNIEESNKNY